MQRLFKRNYWNVKMNLRLIEEEKKNKFKAIKIKYNNLNKILSTYKLNIHNQKIAQQNKSTRKIIRISQIKIKLLTGTRKLIQLKSHSLAQPDCLLKSLIQDKATIVTFFKKAKAKDIPRATIAMTEQYIFTIS